MDRFAAVGVFAAVLSVLTSCGIAPKAEQQSMLAASRPAANASNDDPPQVMREFRAAWVATVGNIDWPSKSGLSTAEQQKEATAILDQAVAMHLNAIVFQVRTSADALYESNIEPWSAFLTGTQGKAPDPFYDPLKFWVEEAHKRGLELHAWFNPYRSRYSGAKGPLAESHVSRQHPDWVREYGSQQWMDPGEAGAADQTFRVFMDVVERYDVDGIHIDDYFYPYPDEAKSGGGEIPFPDDATYARYRKAGGTLKREDWRRENMNALIKRIYEGIHERKPFVRFGISPFGIPRPGLPGIEYISGFDQYEKLAADISLWVKNGWCDYIVPQLYWKISAPQQAYLGLLQWWAQNNPKGRLLYAGLYTSRINDTEKTWFPDEILGQIEIARLVPAVHGEVHFSMKALMENRKKITDKLREGLYADVALPPAAPWLDATPPGQPTNVKTAWIGSATQELTWQPAPGEQAWLWVVQTRRGGTWTSRILPGSARSMRLGVWVIDQAFVTAVDRCGNMSTPARVQK